MGENCFPDISGKWKYSVVNLRRKNPDVKPSFSDIVSVQYDVTIDQKDQFVRSLATLHSFVYT